MPYLSIHTNMEVESVKTKQALLQQASITVASALGKPESYVMLELRTGVDLMFAGTSDAAAYLELKSLGLPDELTPSLSSTLCELLHDNLGIPVNRIYIEFAAPHRHHWGWDKRTF